MQWIKNIKWFLYDTLWSSALEFIRILPSRHRLSIWYEHRRRNSISSIPEQGGKTHVLFACSSVGEYMRIYQIAEYYDLDTKYLIEVSFFSRSGYDYAKKPGNTVGTITYLPIDRERGVSEFLAKRSVDHVLISSNMIWPNFLRMLYRRKIPYSFIGVSFTANSVSRRFYLDRMKTFLSRAEHIFSIDTETQSTLSNYIEASKISVVGDPRVEYILTKSQEDFKREIIIKFKGNRKLLIAGSAHRKEVNILIHNYKQLIHDGYKIIIAPHELNDLVWIKEQLESVSAEYCLYSQDIEREKYSENIMIVDLYGVLNQIYKYADVSLIGGGWDRGIHNIVEAMAAKSPLIIGPYFEKFPEAHFLYKNNAIRIISDKYELVKAVKESEDDQYQEKLQIAYEAYIDQSKSAVKNIINELQLKPQKIH